MKKTYIAKNVFVFALMVSSFCMVSCADDEGLRNNGEVALLSFGPSGVRHGDPIRFVGDNLDKVTSIILPPSVEIGADAFITHTSDVIELVVPEAAEAGQVIVRTEDMDIQSKSVLSFEVPVVIASFSTEAKPGTEITITGEFVNWIESVVFADDVVATEFVSRSLSEVVLTVPMEARTGTITIFTGGTEPLEIQPEDEIMITLPGVTSLTPTVIERGGELTVTGTDLDLVREIKLKGNVTVPEQEFVSKSETEIVLVFPAEANKGTITIVAYSGVEIESADAVAVEGDLPPLEPLAHEIYTDALANGWSQWGGWGGGNSDIANSDNVRDGEKAIRTEFVGGWGGALQFSGSSATAGFTVFAISIYGDAGTADVQLNLILKEGEDSTEKIITIVEGEWVEHKFSIADDLGGIGTITEITLQDRDWSGVLYVDHIGLR